MTVFWWRFGGRAAFAALAAAACIGNAAGRRVSLSNVHLPLDQHGEEIFTGELDVMWHDDFYYFYINDWSTSCPGVNCCTTRWGCAGHCYEKADQPPYVRGCRDPKNGSSPYGLYHFVRVYRTADLTAFENLGIALSVQDRPQGTMFRPKVIFNQQDEVFVMWFNVNQRYVVATSSVPEGPFTVLKDRVTMPFKPQHGDYDLFVDEDGSAYHVRRSFRHPSGDPSQPGLPFRSAVVKLNAHYTGPARLVSILRAPIEIEAPVMFKRKGKYYVLTGKTCCACIVGSNMLVHQADSPAGPWRFLGDIGTLPGVPFDRHNPHLYVTQAQGSSLVEAPAASGEDSVFVWIGNQWNSGLAKTPPGPRNHDALYWAALAFKEDGSLEQLVRTNTTVIDVALPQQQQLLPLSEGSLELLSV